jgi:hypothetical protein
MKSSWGNQVEETREGEPRQGTEKECAIKHRTKEKNIGVVNKIKPQKRVR